MVVVFVAASASSTRSGYAEMALMREIEDLRAETALLRYQIHLGGSDLNVHQAALDLGMCPADAVRDVDYVLLPHPAADPSISRVASRPSADDHPSLPTRLARYATEVIPTGGEAEASVTRGHRP
jgi:hypothetical protein